MKTYIGDKAIQSFQDGERVDITFEDGTHLQLPKKMYEASHTFEPIDATKLQERRVLALIPEMMRLFLEWEICIQDIEVLFAWTSNLINNKLGTANEKLWGGSIKERNLADIERVLAGNPGSEVRDNGDKSTPKGVGSPTGSQKQV